MSTKYIEDRISVVTSHLEHIESVRRDASSLIRPEKYEEVRVYIEIFLLDNLPLDVKRKYVELQEMGESLCDKYPWAARHTELWDSFVRPPEYDWNDALVEAHKRVYFKSRVAPYPSRTERGLQLMTKHGAMPSQSELTQRMIDLSHEALTRSFAYVPENTPRTEFESLPDAAGEMLEWHKELEETAKTSLAYLREADNVLAMSEALYQCFNQPIESTLMMQCIALGQRVRRGLGSYALDTAIGMGHSIVYDEGLNDERGRYLWVPFLEEPEADMPSAIPELYTELRQF